MGTADPARSWIYTTRDGVNIYVEPGKKSAHDFRVMYQEPGKRVRTPRHIHFVVDLFAKRVDNQELTEAFVDYIIDDIILKVEPSITYPPVLQRFNQDDVARFQELDHYGEYHVDFLLVVQELIMIQEKTNYPNGIMNLNLYKSFKQGKDIFSLVSAATFRGRC